MSKRDHIIEEIEHMEFIRDNSKDMEEMLNEAIVQPWADLGSPKTLAELIDAAGAALFYLKEELNVQISKMEDEL